MKHQLPQSSPATPNAASDSNAPDNMEMDFDTIRSLNNIRDRKADAADASLTPNIMDKYEPEDSPRESYTLTHIYSVVGKPMKVSHVFHIDHHEDNVTIITISSASRDTYRKYSVNAARNVYRTLIRRGFKRI